MSHIPRRTFLRQLGSGAVGAAVLGRPVAASAAVPRAEIPLYLGTYTRGRSKGIYTGRLDTSSGRVTIGDVVEGVANPSFLTLSPGASHLYAVSEVSDYEGTPAGAVVAFAIDPRSGGLRQLNRQSSHGAAPCNLIVDATGQFVLVANYTGGSVAVLPILGDGSLGPATDVVQHRGSGPNRQRQEGPHAHSVTLDPSNRVAFVADLGLDRLMAYRFDLQRGSLSPATPPYLEMAPGSGPRHFAFHPNGRRAYVINELNSTLTSLAYSPGTASLRSVQVISTLPADFTGENSCADVHVDRSGRFVYGSNRGHDSIVVYAIDPETGSLTLVQHQPARGRTPRNFGIDPTGRFLLAVNQDSDSLTVFSIDPGSGRLSPVGEPVDVPVPVCIQFG